MDLKATIASGYRNRLILICLGALLYAAWALYDANIGYPDKLKAYNAFQGTKEKYPETWNEEWPKVARENDWDPTKEPEELAAKDIKTQWILFGITFPIGAYCLYAILLWSRRYVGADESKLYAQGGVEVPFDRIVSIDASRWEGKGIARVQYDNGTGQKEILIDDWKYQREPMDAIFERIRENVPAEKITGLTEPADRLPRA